MFSPGQRVMQNPAKCQDENHENVPFFLWTWIRPYICWPLIFNLIESVTFCCYKKNKKLTNNLQSHFIKHLNKLRCWGSPFHPLDFHRGEMLPVFARLPKVSLRRLLGSGTWSSASPWGDGVTHGEVVGGKSILRKTRKKKLLPSNFTAWLKNSDPFEFIVVHERIQILTG